MAEPEMPSQPGGLSRPALRGLVAEIAPEASRQKGTLQIKVQVQKPDRFLTPELSAKVDFLGAEPVAAKR